MKAEIMEQQSVQQPVQQPAQQLVQQPVQQSVQKSEESSTDKKVKFNVKLFFSSYNFIKKAWYCLPDFHNYEASTLHFQL